MTSRFPAWVPGGVAVGSSLARRGIQKGRQGGLTRVPGVTFPEH